MAQEQAKLFGPDMARIRNNQNNNYTRRVL